MASDRQELVVDAAVVRGPRRWPLYAGALLGTVIGAALVTHGLRMAWLGPFLAAGWLLQRARYAVGSVGPMGRVAASRGRMCFTDVDGTLELAVDPTSAEIVDHGGAAADLRLKGRGRGVCLRVPDARRARALAFRVGVAPAGVRETLGDGAAFVGFDPLVPWIAVGVSLALVGSELSTRVLGGIVATLVALVVWAAVRTSSRVVLGVDGVSVNGRFVSRAELVGIDRVRESTGGVLFRLLRREGRPVEVLVGARPRSDGQAEGAVALSAAAFEARVRRLLDIAAPATSAVLGPLGVAAHGEDRLARLRALLGHTAYRAAAVDADDALDAVADGALPVPLRARAAVVAAASSETVRLRLADLADHLAHPRLRAAVLQALDGEDEALLATLGELDRADEAGAAR